MCLRKMKILKKTLLVLVLCSLSLLAISCNDKKDISERREMTITEHVDSKYVQPEDLYFIYNKTGNNEYLEVCYIGPNREEINIAPEYGGIKVLDYIDANAYPPSNYVTKKLILPDTIENIDGYMCNRFLALEELVLPKNLKYIGPYTLRIGTIKSISISIENGYYKVLNNKLIDIKNNRLIKAFNINDDEITISGCKQIGDMAFYKTNLKSIKFDEGIEEISGDSISYNDSLESITLPSTLKKLVVSFNHERIPDDYRTYAIFNNNSNLKTIYNYSNVELDLSDKGIEVIKMNK